MVLSNLGRPSSASTGQFVIEPIIVFYIFSAVSVTAALFAPIQDCDEVYNYWEPTHYLNHGYGRQTWEYSPEFSIRSWLYIAFHAAVGKAGSLLWRGKIAEFYLIRIILGLLCAFCETKLFGAISRTLNSRIALIFMLVMLSSPGMFYASAAFLPSSFAMCTSMLGASAFLDWRLGENTAPGIMWFGIGGIVGWPFASALVAPFLLEEVVLATITRDGIETARKFLDGTLRCLIVLVRESVPRPC